MRAVARALVVVGGLASLFACSSAEGEAELGHDPRRTWTKTWGTAGDDFARSVAVAPSGAVFVAGYTDGAFGDVPNAGAWDAFLTRWDGGSATWSRQWGGDGPEFAQALVLDDDGGAFVAGYTPSGIDGQAVRGGHDAFLTHFDATGGYDFTRQWGTDADDYVYAAARAPQGVVVVGYTKGSFEGFGNAGAADVFVTLAAWDGTVLWTRQLGSDATDYAQAVHVDAAGNVLVAGYTAGKLGEDEDLGAEDAFVLALDAQGEQLWLRQWGSETTDYALGVSSDPAGNAYVVGYAYGDVAGEPAIGGEDAYLTKLDAAGVRQWTRQFGTLGRDSARFVSVDQRGDVLVGGDTEGDFAASSSAGGRDAFLKRFDADGTENFSSQWGNIGSEFSLAGDVAASALYIVGYVEPATGSRDAWLTRWAF